MAHFAEIDSSNVVCRVLVVPDAQQHRGEAYLRDDLGLSGRWVQTSFSATHRKRFAGIGMTYDTQRDAFVLPLPFSSWVLDDRGDWQPPVPKPDGHGWVWDDANRAWARTD